MDKITDPFEFDRHIEALRENAASLPATQGHLIELLAMLIEDALAEFAGEKFILPRSMGGLDDADGIQHLFDDYPPQVPPGKVFREAFLSTNEDAAAHYLLKLYLARDFLDMGFGLPEESICEIEATGLDLLKWRLWGPAFQHGRDKAKQSRNQRKRASKTRAPVTRSELEGYRNKFIYDHGCERGWIKAACLKFGIDRKTLAKRMEE